MYYAIYRTYGKLNKMHSENWDDVEHLPDIVDLFKSDVLTLPDFNDMFSLMRSLEYNKRY